MKRKTNRKTKMTADFYLLLDSMTCVTVIENAVIILT